MKKDSVQKLVFAIFILIVLGAVAAMDYAIDMITFGAFILILGGLIFKDRKKVKFQGLAFIRRTERANKFIDRTARKNKRTLRPLFSIGVVVGILALIGGSLFMITTAYDIATGKLETGGAGIVLPGPVSSPIVVPGVFILPWWIWILGIMLVMIPHEFSHGLVFRLEKIKIKSVGWIVFIVLPGAFVEPDEKQLQGSKRSAKLKAYAAGSFANLFVAFVIAVIVGSYADFAPFSSPSGLFFQQVEGFPAAELNITGALVDIGGKSIRSQDDLSSVLSGYSPGDSIRLTTREIEGNFNVNFNGNYELILPEAVIFAEFGESRTYNVRLVENPNREGVAFLGVAFPGGPNRFQIHSTDNILGIQIVNFIVWMYVFSFGIGLINLLPIKPLDGGLLFEEIVGKFSKRKKNVVKIVRIVSVVMLLLLLFNIFGAFII